MPYFNSQMSRAATAAPSLKARGAPGAMLAAYRARFAPSDAGAGDVAAYAGDLAGLGHALRTPMNAIRGFAGMLKEFQEAGGDRTPEYADYILRAADDHLRRIETLLEIARLDAGETGDQPEAFDAGGLLRDAVNAVAGAADAAGRRIEDKTGEGAIPASGDPDLIARGLRHVLRDALERSAGDEAVFVRAAPIETGAEILARSYGAGVDEAALAAARDVIGDPAAGRSRAFRPYGALAFGERLITLDGGEFSVRSKDGAGALCRIRLPRAKNGIDGRSR